MIIVHISIENRRTILVKKKFETYTLSHLILNALMYYVTLVVISEVNFCSFVIVILSM